jgi:hypothetical protein
MSGLVQKLKPIDGEKVSMNEVLTRFAPAVQEFYDSWGKPKLETDEEKIIALKLETGVIHFHAYGPIGTPEEEARVERVCLEYHYLIDKGYVL